MRFFLRLLGYPVPFWSSLNTLTRTRTHAPRHVYTLVVHHTMRNVHFVQHLPNLSQTQLDRWEHFLCCQLLPRALVFHTLLRCTGCFGFTGHLEHPEGIFNTIFEKFFSKVFSFSSKCMRFLDCDINVADFCAAYPVVLIFDYQSLLYHHSNELKWLITRVIY